MSISRSRIPGAGPAVPPVISVPVSAFVVGPGPCMGLAQKKWPDWRDDGGSEAAAQDGGDRGDKRKEVVSRWLLVEVVVVAVCLIKPGQSPWGHF